MVNGQLKLISGGWEDFFGQIYEAISIDIKSMVMNVNL